MFKDIFIKLCNERNIAPTAVCKDIGLTGTSYSKWTSTSIPRQATLYKIADYFNVSVDYLLGNDSLNNDEINKTPNEKLYTVDNQNVHMIPLFESVSAGFGALAVNDIVDYIPLYIESLMEAKETICIKVRGDSMFPKIEDGDIIQVHKQDSVDNGQIGVVLLDNEDGLVKKIIYGETWIELHSINPMYKIMRFNGPDVQRVRIVGLVKKVIKDLQ